MPLTEYKWDDWQQLSVVTDGWDAMDVMFFVQHAMEETATTVWHDKV